MTLSKLCLKNVLAQRRDLQRRWSNQKPFDLRISIYIKQKCMCVSQASPSCMYNNMCPNYFTLDRTMKKYFVTHLPHTQPFVCTVYLLLIVCVFSLGCLEYECSKCTRNVQRYREKEKICFLYTQAISYTNTHFSIVCEPILKRILVFQCSHRTENEQTRGLFVKVFITANMVGKNSYCGILFFKKNL